MWFRKEKHPNSSNFPITTSVLLTSTSHMMYAIFYVEANTADDLLSVRR
jgi:hypothetical protein